MYYNLTLLRHGESEGNASGVIQGRLDLPLTPAGQQQAQELARYWQFQQMTFDAIISSPLKRAYQTALTIAQSLKLEVEIDEDWCERGFGIGEGLNPEVVRAQNPGIDFYHPYLNVVEGGETSIDVYQRVLSALIRVLRRPPGRYLIVSHGATLNMTFYAVMGITPQGHQSSPRFRFGNTAYANWSYNPETRQWYLLNFLNKEDWSVIGDLGAQHKI